MQMSPIRRASARWLSLLLVAALAHPIKADQQANPAYYYADSTALDDQSEGDLNFDLMVNAPQERLQAVQSLVQDSQQLNTRDPQDGRLANPAEQLPAMRCNHKGRQFSHGQTVPIEEQPCLNCTCRRAVLQCYLRVCPPVVSHEAQRKLQAEPGRTGQRCRLAKEPHQCCPSVRCEPAETGNSSMSSPMSAPASSTAATSLARVQPEVGSTELEALQTEASTAAASIGGGQSAANNRSLASSTVGPGRWQDQSQNQSSVEPVEPSLLPKLTVINGPAGQRDSILLITSNPNPHNQSQTGNRAGHGSLSKAEFSTALMEALLDTVYSSGAQLSGLNLEGSCMINGSLYVEGSAVIPEGNVLCQYCYCIRQKIMCVKPKCQLFISGCSPKYSHEFACCPTSYSCGSSAGSSAPLPGSLSQLSPVSVAGLLSGDSGAAPLTQRSGAAEPAGQVHSVSSRLWAAIESLTKQLPLRGAERALAAEGLTTSAPSAASTTTSSSSSSSSSSTSSSSSSSSTTSSGAQVEPDEPSSGGGGGGGGGGGSSANLTSARTEPQQEATASLANGDSEEPAPVGTSAPVPGSTSPAVQPPGSSSSVSDFLEPMSRLGPLVVSPAAPAGCLENGRQYTVGEQIPTLESCRHCYCGLEGMKECKMIGCSLKSVHNCRPIIPEGHCCPVRYECPPEPARYRSQLDEWEEPRQAAEQQWGSSSVAPESQPSLGEELNKFIMLINQTGQSAAPPAGGRSAQDYHGVQAPEPGSLGVPAVQVLDEGAVSVRPEAPEDKETSTGANETEATGSPAPPVARDETRAPPAPGEPAEAVSGPNEAAANQRDSRSTEAKFKALNEMLEEHGLSVFTEMAHELSPPTRPPEAGPGVSAAAARQLARALLRPAGGGEQPGPGVPAPALANWAAARQSEREHGANMVLFDDDQAAEANETAAGRPAAAAEPSRGSAGRQAAQEGSTPVPPGPTTGTPFGLDQEELRQPEGSSGWLRSLQGFVHSFGRRLSGEPVGQLQAAAAGAPEHQLVRQSQPETVAAAPALETGRSRPSSLLGHLFRGVVGPAEPLVMRPLDLVLSAKPAGGQPSQPSQQSKPSHSTPAESDREELAESRIARRSELMASEASSSQPIISSQPDMAHLVRGGGHAREPPLRQLAEPARQPLACHDAANNRSYLANEMIPKQDPCLTCTCVLGEELCQRLVCPIKPAEDCSEERRPGQCCASYLCGASVTELAAPSASTSAPVMQKQLMRYQIAPVSPNNQLTLPARQPQVTAQDQNANSLALREGRLSIGQLLAAQRSAGSLIAAPPSGPAHPQQPIRGSSPLPGQPIRTSDLAHLLPQHLRFRPAGLSQPASSPVQASNQLFAPMHQPQLYGSMDRNRLLFGPQQSRPLPVVQQASWRPNQPAGSLIFASGPFDSSRLYGPSRQQPPGLQVLAPVLGHPAAHGPPLALGNPPINTTLSQPMAPLRPTLLRAGFHEPIAAGHLATSIAPPEVLASKQIPMDEHLESSTSNEISEATQKQNQNQDRLLFSGTNQPATSSFPTPIALDSGFHPIQPPVWPALSVLEEEQQQQQHKSRNQLQASNIAAPESSETVKQLMAATFAEHQTTVASNQPITNELVQLESVAPSSIGQQPVKQAEAEQAVSGGSGIEITSTELIGNQAKETSSSSTTPNTVTIASSTDKDTSSVLDEQDSESNPESNGGGSGSQEFDSIASMFRVSECNIYGRIYKVGQSIDELSNSCKRCKCTNMGVDCQQICP